MYVLMLAGYLTTTPAWSLEYVGRIETTPEWDPISRWLLSRQAIRCSHDTSLIKINVAYSARNQTVLCGKNAGLLKPKMDAKSFSSLL
jgi:hypothetical protein